MITRYKMFADNRVECGCEIDESSTGNYVKYNDYMDEVKAFGKTIDCKQLEINKLHTELNLLQEDVSTFQYLIKKFMKVSK